MALAKEYEFLASQGFFYNQPESRCVRLKSKTKPIAAILGLGGGALIATAACGMYSDSTTEYTLMATGILLVFAALYLLFKRFTSASAEPDSPEISTRGRLNVTENQEKYLSAKDRVRHKSITAYTYDEAVRSGDTHSEFTID